MCESCGCGDHELVPVEIQERILAGNDHQARHNREHFHAAGVVALVAAANAARMTLLDKQLVEAALALSLAELEIALEVSVGRPLESIQ